MSAPRRTGDHLALLELLQLQTAAELADGRRWLKAYEMVRDQRVTAKEAARTLGVSEVTFWRKVKPWALHLAEGNGVGG